jgi:hypothetical protein
MLRWLRDAITPSKGRSLAVSLSRLGWFGFWLQVIFGSLPIMVLVYYYIFSRPTASPSQGFGFTEYMTIINLFLLAFTTYWSYRYTRIGSRLRGPDPKPSEASVVGTVWTGIMATTMGMLISMIAVLAATGALLFSFLKAPQGGIPVFQTPSTEAVRWVSTIDVIDLMALVLFLFAEQIVLVFNLWLLFRASLGTPEAAPSQPKSGSH